MSEIPWFKVDDTFAMHEKVMAAGNAAVGLWVRAGAWSMQQLTDGFVPNHVVRALGTPKERRTLVEVSLWEESQGGVQFKNWDERQPTKVQVETARQAAADRQRHARERAKSQRESRRDTGVSHGPPDPTQPDPTRSSSGTTTPSGEASRKRARQLPSDWQPTEQHRAFAADNLLNITDEAAQFTDHHRAKGSTMKDWDAAFRTWLRNAVKWRKDTPQQPRRLPHVDELEQPPDGLSDEEYATWWAAQRERRRA